MNCENLSFKGNCIVKSVLLIIWNGTLIREKSKIAAASWRDWLQNVTLKYASLAQGLFWTGYF